MFTPIAGRAVLVTGASKGIGKGIARAFAVKTRPVVVHVHTSAEQMSAWRRRGAARVHG